jgi:hypothetical protein
MGFLVSRVSLTVTPKELRPEVVSNVTSSTFIASLHLHTNPTEAQSSRRLRNYHSILGFRFSMIGMQSRDEILIGHSCGGRSRKMDRINLA